MHTPSPRLALATAAIALAGFAIAVALPTTPAAAPTPTPASASAAALSVSVTGLQPARFAMQLQAHGDIAAWQEASIGSEAQGLRLAEVLVDVGERVRRGQLLARFAAETVEAELALARASVAEAEEAWRDAAANADRAGTLEPSGALSAQQVQQYRSAERMAQARLDAARATQRAQQLRLAQTRVHAPDDGVVSARSATVGAVPPAGQELFRLVRGGRLEWRAEVAAPELARLQPGQAASIVPVGGAPIAGRLRQLAPLVDPQTRNGLVYVDLPAGTAARAGMFARGSIVLGAREVQTLPHSAVLLREGFSHVLRVEPDARVRQIRVTTGQREGERIEIVDGLAATDRVVVAGAAFLGDGDSVRVIDAPEMPR